MTDPTEPTPFELEADEEAAIQAAVPPPAGALLTAEDIVAGYVPEVNILNGVAVTVAPGELIGLIDPNGAGDSTFLKALFGATPSSDARRGGNACVSTTSSRGSPDTEKTKKYK